MNKNKLKQIIKSDYDRNTYVQLSRRKLTFKSDNDFKAKTIHTQKTVNKLFEKKKFGIK